MRASKLFPKPVPPNAMSYQIQLRDGPWRRTRTVVVTAGSGHQEELDAAVRAILKEEGKSEYFTWQEVASPRPFGRR